MAFVFRNLTKVDSSPVVSNNVRGTKVGRKGDGKRKTRSLSLAYSLPITLCALILPVGYPRFEDDWRRFREESIYKIIETFVIAAFPKEQQAVLLVFYFSRSLLYGPCMDNPFLKMLMRAKSAGFLIFSLTKDARCKPATNSYARHVILTPRLLNSFSLPFLPKKSILGNLVLTILFLLTMRTAWRHILWGEAYLSN